MLRITLGISSTLLIIFIIPIIVYGLFSMVFEMKTPDGVTPIRFLISVFISKLGTAILFTILFYLSKDYFSSNWILYVLLWLIMFILGEIGQLIGPNYSWQEAVAGIISEIIYLPLSMIVLRLIIK